MALDLTSRYPGRYGAKTAEYPQGSFENETALGNNDRSYFEQDWTNDVFGFLGAILAAAGETPNNTIDTATSSQFFNALGKVFLNSAPDIFTVESSSTWNKPAGDYIYWEVTAIGGGGGGSGGLNVGTSTAPATTGGGGSSGDASVIFIANSSMPSSVSVTVGAGGASTAVGNAAGVSGGNTSFGGLCVADGGAGAPNDNNLGRGAGASLHAAHVGDMLFSGNHGHSGALDPLGLGLSTPFSIGGGAGGAAIRGSYGEGGRGSTYSSPGNLQGINGAAGAVIIKGYK